jgi:hypothetical protein
VATRGSEHDGGSIPYASAQGIFSRTQGIFSVRRECREFGAKSMDR